MAATAVFPTRLPEPITARAGWSSGAKGTGSRRKSAPDVRDAGRERARGEPEAAARPDDGLVGEVDDDLRPASASAVGEVLQSGTP